MSKAQNMAWQAVETAPSQIIRFERMVSFNRKLETIKEENHEGGGTGQTSAPKNNNNMKPQPGGLAATATRAAGAAGNGFIKRYPSMVAG